MSATPADVRTLLARLRGAGLRVGVTEALRLGRVLELEPALDVAGLRRLVTGVVAKSKDEVEAIGRVIEEWRGEAEVWLEAWRKGRRARAATTAARIDRAPRAPWWIRIRRIRWRRVRWQRALAAALLLGGIEAALFRALRPQPVDVGDLVGWSGAAERVVALPPAAQAILLEQPETSRVVVPEIRELPRQPSYGRVAVLLGLSALLGGSLWQRYRGRSGLPPPAPVADRPGPSRVLLRPPPEREPQLLLAAEEEALVWGIERFVGEEPGERLDVAASVAATAKNAGRPALEFERIRHHREVWLWCDASADDPFLQRLAEEVQASLETAGLVVERGEFWGVPHHLVAGGVEMAPNELDERRDAAIVAVLTDGRLLGLELESAEQRPRCEALLRELSRWPRLAFVDFGDGRAVSLLAPRKIETVAPSEAFAFLGGVRRPPRRRAPAAGDLLAWSAACALPAQPADEATAHALRRVLGLEVSPWELRSLFGGHGGVGRLRFEPAERARLLGWLLGSEAGDDGGIAAESLLARALDFWEERYATEEKERRDADGAVPWIGTPAEQQLRLERLLLRLWRQPEEAAAELYALFRAGRQEAVRQGLRDLAPRDRVPEGAEEAVLLPWAASGLPPRVQVMLREMGLGERWRVELPGQLRRPGRLLMAAGLFGGLLLGGTFGLAGVDFSAPRIEQRNPPTPTEVSVARVAGTVNSWRVEAPGPQAAVWKAVRGGARVEVVWEEVREQDQPGSIRVNSIDGSAMVYVPRGEYTLGSGEEAHRVQLSPFWIGKNPVTNERYRRYLDANLEPNPVYWNNERFNQDLQPVVGVSWNEARAYCQWAGMDLPTEAQWEAAARGTDQRPYPWGDEPPTDDLADYGQDFDTGRPAAVGTHPLGAGPFGTLDQAGNVWEWCLDVWDPTAYEGRDGEVDPVSTQGEGGRRVVRGGSWVFPARFLAAAFRFGFQPSVRYQGLGFRCVWSVPAEPGS